jgi:hypothetical protein
MGKRPRLTHRLRARQEVLQSRRKRSGPDPIPQVGEEDQVEQEGKVEAAAGSVDIFSLADKWLAGAAFTPVEKLVAVGTLALTLWWIISPSTFLFGLLGGQVDVGSAWDRVWLALLMLILLGVVYLVRAVRKGL